MSENHGVKTCAISYNPVPVADVEHNEDLLNNPHHPQYLVFQEKFPKYWKEAKVLNKYGLL